MCFYLIKIYPANSIICVKYIFNNFAEENQKRSTTGYGQIGFNYDDSPSRNSGNEKTENENKDEPPDEVYVPHHRFYIPPNMDLVGMHFSIFHCILYRHKNKLFLYECVPLCFHVYSRKQQKCRRSLKKRPDLYLRKVHKWRFLSKLNKRTILYLIF